MTLKVSLNDLYNSHFYGYYIEKNTTKSQFYQDKIGRDQIRSHFPGPKVGFTRETLYGIYDWRLPGSMCMAVGALQRVVVINFRLST